MSETAHLKARRGDLIVFSTGEYSDYGYTGHFVALEDITGGRRSDQYVFDGLFAAARRHIAAIGQAESLLPFESALLAMLLEQS